MFKHRACWDSSTELLLYTDRGRYVIVRRKKKPSRYVQMNCGPEIRIEFYSVERYSYEIKDL